MPVLLSHGSSGSEASALFVISSSAAVRPKHVCANGSAMVSTVEKKCLACYTCYKTETRCRREQPTAREQFIAAVGGLEPRDLWMVTLFLVYEITLSLSAEKLEFRSNSGFIWIRMCRTNGRMTRALSHEPLLNFPVSHLYMIPWPCT